MTIKQRKHCRRCRCYWVGGVKDGVHDNWCTKYSKAASEALGHCTNMGGREMIDIKNVH